MLVYAGSIGSPMSNALPLLFQKAASHQAKRLAMQIRTRKPATRRNPRGSCIECFKRKKKCDKEQPCYNCTRRYPPVECVYQKLELPPRYEAELPSPLSASSSEDVESKQDPSSNALQLLSKDLVLTTAEPVYGIGHGHDELDSGHSEVMVRLMMQKYPKLPSIEYSVGCGTLDTLRMLSVEGTSSNAMFLETHNNLMTRFDYSVDGSGKAPELYENAWMPFTTNSPLLLHLNLLKAAIARCQPWQPETNFEKKFLYYSPPSEPTNQAAVIRLRLRAISLLKARLKSPTLSIDDESIAAACYMIYLEWTWNDANQEFTGLMTHVNAVREMLRQRGGLNKLGQSTVLATVVMLAHYHLATNLECDGFVVPPELLKDKFTPDHKPAMPGIDSPLWISSGTFSENISTSGFHLATARILDRMSFLTAQVRTSVFTSTSTVHDPQTMLFARSIYSQLSALPSAHSTPPHPPDYIYEVVRLASIVYSRAILQHIKFSQSCSPDVLAALLEAASHIPLQKWKDMPGIWLFILLVVNAGARFTRQGRLSRALTRICSFSIALRDWQSLVNILESFLAVQKWIAEWGAEKEPT